MNRGADVDGGHMAAVKASTMKPLRNVTFASIDVRRNFHVQVEILKDRRCLDGRQAKVHQLSQRQSFLHPSSFHNQLPHHIAVLICPWTVGLPS